MSIQSPKSCFITVPIIIMMHNKFFESGESTPVPGTCRKWSNCFDFYFDNKS